MNDYIIMTDSCVDITDEMAKKLNLACIPLSCNIKGKEYFNYLDEREMSAKNFYSLLRKNIVPSTTQINPNRFVEFMEPFLAKGLDILYISFSSALSGTYNSSIIAKDELKNKYPERKIVIIDSLCASMGQGLLVTYAAKRKTKGENIDEVASWVDNNKTNICHLFTVGDLNHLRRGGRLSYAKAFLGTIIRIKPLLHVNIEGKLVQTGSTRGRAAALRKMVERMKNTIELPEEQVIYISHGDCLKEVIELKAMILKEIKVKDIIINFVGPVIGSHSGVGTIAIFYLGNDRFLKY